jgi:NAD(P)-dependent dehydrogenase (short-subunit alcohol dehydrogenase family)/rhamnose utilization protein RhaD (predicted bifunctional aldolase and dehydrogenase)
MRERMEQLIAMSHRYGGDGRYVLAGGGNTSVKEGGVLYVKASGTRLSNVGEDGFVRMSMEKIAAMFEKEYPKEDKQRESEALADMMDARLAGETNRPSVECMLHGLFPQTFVLHLHPALVNGLTCGTCGRQYCETLFGDRAVWVPLTKPGYTLAKACYDLFEQSKTLRGSVPGILFMQNHGVIVAADTLQEIDARMALVMETIEAKAGKLPDFTPQVTPEEALAAAPALRMLYRKNAGKACAVFHRSDAVLRLALEDVRKPFNPDQIVYCKAALLELEAGTDITKAFAAFVEKNGYAPKIAVMPGVGVFGLGKTKKEADTALSLFLDAVQIAAYARGFGGPLPLTDDFTNFILQWEVENYRQKVAFTAGNVLRMDGKICIVTGAAQGFGEGIARAIAAQGGYTVIADMNEQGAKAVAASLCAQYGEGIAVGVLSNVTDETSVKAMVDAAVSAYGGLDVMVSCAGIVISGDLAALRLDQFQKVTAVNYTGYYLCAKYAAAVMKLQRAADPAYMADIIEINSKSGLEGSKANFAYAGSKFGGIGLTQSFALELAPYGVKVNAICPGNLLDGPLWSDPEKGLFKQYLDAGKVPGAKNVGDVRKFYEAKVPLGRGCLETDVAKAIFYIVEQEYETGQAVPVTGGQVMLN